MFKNSYVRNNEIAKEVYKYLYFQRKSSLICIILSIVVFAESIILFLLGDDNFFYFLIFSPLYILYKFYAYRTQVKTVIKRDEEVYGGPATVETTVSDNSGFTHTMSPTKTGPKIEFSKIRRAIVTKNLIILHSNANLLYILKKDAFTEGNAEDFISLLKNVGIKVSGK